MYEYVLAIDDTGFDKKDKNYEILKSEESCFVSVLIRNELVPVINKYMKQKTQSLMKDFGSNEFHFTDIYNRNGNFKNIDINDTLAIVRSFVQDMIDCEMLITVSTINKHSHNDNQQKLLDMINNNIIPNINLPEGIDSTNLILNIIRSDKTLTDNIESDAKIVEAFCDEGLRKSGSKFTLNLSKGPVDVLFQSSTNYLLQFADFAAWFVTRIKHISN